jgi:hypothetical protein
MIPQIREEIAGALLGAYASRKPIDPLTESVTARSADGGTR